MFTFEEYVMFSALSDGTKKQLAEKFAEKRLSPEEIRMANAMGLSCVDTWAQKQLS